MEKIGSLSTNMQKSKLVNFKDRWGGTPVSEAAWHGHDECVRVMRKAGG